MIRIAKYLAHAGLGSRRTMEEWILAGKIKVNNVVITQCATFIDPENDTITIDGKPFVVEAKDFTYLMINKPSGYLSTTEDTHGRKTVLDLLPEEYHGKKLILVGRLDKESEGLMFLTDNGALAHVLMHPSFEKEKEYIVHFRGQVKMTDFERLREGVYIPLEDEKTALVKAHQINTILVGEKRTKATITLTEGKKRQLRLMGEAIAHPVTYLSRVRIGPLELGDLPLGSTRTLTEKEITTFLALL